MTDQPTFPSDDPKSNPGADPSDKTFGYVATGNSSGGSQLDTRVDSSAIGLGTILSSEMPALPKSGVNLSGADSATAVWIGQYRVVGELGRGGMGVVYKVRHRIMPRYAALKMILNSDRAGEEQRRRFEIDAAALASLEHDSIVRMYEYGEHGTNPFFVMEYIEGGSLADALRDAPPMDFVRAASILRKLARAVSYAHQKGIVHRDLKPANILMNKEGLPKITDFGLARMQSEQNSMAANNGQPLTPAGQVMGTPAYMAPEQAKGTADGSDHRADIYSLGAILYELLAGRPPFKGNQMEILHQLWSKTPPTPLIELRPDVPVDLEAVCRRCMEPDPSERYFSASELLADLERLESGLPTSGPAYQAPSALLRPNPSSGSQLSGVIVPRPGFAVRHLSKLAIAGVVLVVAAVGLGLALRNPNAAQAEALKKSAEEETRKAKAAWDGQKRLDALMHLKIAADKWNELCDLSSGERAMCHERIARLHLDRGILHFERLEMKDAEEALKTSQVEFAKANREPFEVRLAEATVEDTLGTVWQAQKANNYKDAQNNWNEALKHFEEAKTLREALQRYSPTGDSERNLLRDIAISHAHIGDVQVKLKDFKGAKKSYDKSMSIRQKLVETDKDDPESKLYLSRGTQNLCRLFRIQGKLPETEARCKEALSQLTWTSSEGAVGRDTRRDYITYNLFLAEVLMDEAGKSGIGGKAEREVETLLKAVEDACKDLGRGDANDPFLLTRSAQLNLDQAKLKYLTGKMSEASREIADAVRALDDIPLEKLRPEDRIRRILSMALTWSRLPDERAEERAEIAYTCVRELEKAHKAGFNSFDGLRKDVAAKLLIEGSKKFKETVDKLDEETSKSQD